MKSFVFYTYEGYTESPTSEPLENIQLLGFESGKNIKLAKQKLITQRKWIEKTGFDKCEIEATQLLDDKLRKLVKSLVDYNWDSEKKHYEESPDKNHIFLVLKQIKKIID
jgi:hypothetical protein